VSWLSLEGTALCPYCDIDSVIRSASGFDLTKQLLSKMNEYWFDGQAAG
jgi:hypothetical protein